MAGVNSKSFRIETARAESISYADSRSWPNHFDDFVIGLAFRPEFCNVVLVRELATGAHVLMLAADVRFLREIKNAHEMFEVVHDFGEAKP